MITFDLRGHGQSDRPQATSAYGPSLCEDVLRLLDHLGVERADFIGYSLGAWVGLGVLATAPGRLNSCALIACGTQGLDRQHNFFLADVLDGIPCTEPSRKREADVVLYIAELFRNDAKALAALLRSQWAVSLDRLIQNRSPVLLLSGETDAFVPDPEDLRRRIGSSAMVVIPDADHVTVLGHPACQEGVLALLQEHGLKA